MCRAIKALAIFHPSAPSAVIGTAANAPSVPSVVPSAPTTKHGNKRADPRSTRRTSAVNSNMGTASGNKNPLIIPYVGASVGMIPAFASASAASVLTSGAPPAFAPHGRFSAQSPNAPHASTAVQTPSASVGAMSARVAASRVRRVRDAPPSRTRDFARRSRAGAGARARATDASASRDMRAIDARAFGRRRARRARGEPRERHFNARGAVPPRREANRRRARCRRSRSRRRRRRRCSSACWRGARSRRYRSRSRRFDRGNRWWRRRGTGRTTRGTTLATRD